MSAPAPADHAFLLSLPKCEHHLHIEGSLSPAVLFSLAARNAIPLPPSDPAYSSPSTLATRYQSFTSLDDFLSYYYTGLSVLLHAQDFADLTWAYLVRAHADGVRHAELFFDPQAHLARGVAVATVLQGMRGACARAHSELAMSTLVVPCFLRHLPASDALAVLRSDEFGAAVARKDVVGVGLDSSEAGFAPELFADVYREAKGMGLRLTAHAAEEGPARNVAAALDMGCERIDHGVRLVEDEEVLRRVVAERVMLTVCPLSNVALRVKKSVADLPIREFLDRGVRFSINSDDPEYLGGYIMDSYVAVQDAFGLSREEWMTICRHALEGSWCGKERRDELLRMLDDI